MTQNHVQTTLVPAGGSAIVDFRVDVPGTLVMVDHSLFRAFNKGALGMIKVEGSPNLITYSGKEVDAVYLGRQATAGTDEGKTLDSLRDKVQTAIAADPTITGLKMDIQMEKGKRVYMQNCFVCHQAEGQGLPGVFPPLAKSDFLMADKHRAISAVISGLSGPIKVNDKEYNGVMPPVALNDEQVANVITYIQNSWGNTSDPVLPEDVSKLRAEGATQ